MEINTATYCLSFFEKIPFLASVFDIMFMLLLFRANFRSFHPQLAAAALGVAVAALLAAVFSLGRIHGQREMWQLLNSGPSDAGFAVGVHMLWLSIAPPLFAVILGALLFRKALHDGAA